MKLYKIICSLISVILTCVFFLSKASVGDVMVQKTTTKDSVYCKHASNGDGMHYYKSGFSSIINSSRTEYILDHNMLQIDKNACAVYEYNPIVLSDIDIFLKTHPFSFYQKRQKALLDTLNEIDLDLEEGLQQYSINTYYNTKKSQIKIRIDSLLEVEKELFSIDYEKDVSLVRIKSIILTATTLYKGSILKRYSDMYNTIYNFRAYAEKHKQKLLHAQKNILVQYSVEELKERLKFIKTVQPLDPLFLSQPTGHNYKLNLFNRNNMRLEYLLNSIYMNIYTIREFLNEGSVVKYLEKRNIKVKGIDKLTEVILYVLDQFNLTKQNFYTAVSRIPNLESFLKDIHKIYTNYIHVLINIHVELENDISSLYLSASLEDASYRITMKRVKELVDYAIKDIKQTEKKFENRLLRTNIFINSHKNAQKKKVPLENLVMKQTNISTKSLLPEYMPEIDYIKVTGENIYKIAQNSKNMDALILLQNQKSFGADIYKSPQIILNRYAFQNPNRYISCYNTMSEIISNKIAHNTDLCSTRLARSMPLLYSLKKKVVGTKEEEQEENESILAGKFNMLMYAIFEDKYKINQYNRCMQVDQELLKYVLEQMYTGYILSVTSKDIEEISNERMDLILTEKNFTVTEKVKDSINVLKDTLIDSIENITSIKTSMCKQLLRASSHEIVVKKFLQENSYLKSNNTVDNFSSTITYKGHYLDILIIMLNMRSDLEKEMKNAGIKGTDGPDLGVFWIEDSIYKSYFTLFSVTADAIDSLYNEMFKIETLMNTQVRNCRQELSQAQSNIKKILLELNEEDANREEKIILGKIEQKKRENPRQKIPINLNMLVDLEESNPSLT